MGADFTLKDNENRNFLHVAIKQGFPVANLECAIIKVCAIIPRCTIKGYKNDNGNMHFNAFILIYCQTLPV